MARLELTLAILKPDLFMRNAAREKVTMLVRRKGFLIIQQADLHLSRDAAEQFYSEHRGKFFYNRLVDFMCVGPIHCMVLAHPNAIQHWREIMGPTKPPKAQFVAPESIRGMYGLTDTRNSTHGSDSKASAEREIKHLFPDFNIHEWYQRREVLLRNGPVKFSETDQIHIVE